MKKLSIVLGQDMSGYHSFEIEVDEIPSDDELIDLAEERESELFEPNFETKHSLRIVSIVDLENDLPVANRILCDPDYKAAGEQLEQFLQGNITFQRLLECAVECGLIKQPEKGGINARLTTPSDPLPGVPVGINLTIPLDTRKVPTMFEMELALGKKLSQFVNVEFLNNV